MLARDATTVILHIGEVLTVTPSGGGSGTVTELVDGNTPQSAPVAVSGTPGVWGPFNTTKLYRVVCTTSSLAVDTALAEPLSQREAEVVFQPITGNSVLLITGAGVPTDNVTGADVTEIGSLYLDSTNGKAYINGGTKALPVWKLITSAT